MNTFIVCFVAISVVLVSAEPPVGYSYSKPSGHGGGSFIGGSLGHIGGGGGGGYIAVSHGYQTSEGQHVDPALLEQVRQILLKEELNSHSGGGGGGHHGIPSSSYGVPSSSYGVPHYATRVVGIDLDGVRQAIQVAQYKQTTHESFGGYPSGPSVPTGSYGVPH